MNFLERHSHSYFTVKHKLKIFQTENTNKTITVSRFDTMNPLSAGRRATVLNIDVYSDYIFFIFLWVTFRHFPFNISACFTIKLNFNLNLTN